MLILCPGSKFFHPGTRVKNIPDPGSGSASKILSIFNPKNCFYALGILNRVVHSGSGTRIPDPGVKKAANPDPQHWFY